jgi:4'-phosphopantetheinyl transferase EntD
MEPPASPDFPSRAVRDADRFQALVPGCVLLLEEPVSEAAGPLEPAEAALAVHAGDKRRTEFTAGRVLARRVLAQLGAPQAPLGADADGVPAWPAGFVGCITHGAGRVAAAAAARAEVAGIGIDMEAVMRFHPELESQFLSQAEVRQQLAATSGAERQARCAVLFCAKEAWFKCQFPLTRRRLGFDEARVEVDWDSGRFVLWPAEGAGAQAGVPGCSSVGDGIARAAIVLEPARLSLLEAWRPPGAR